MFPEKMVLMGGNSSLPDAASDTLMFKQSQQVVGPLLKVLVDDLSNLLVVGNLGIEGFAGDGVDVCDELMLDGRAHHFRANYSCATCDDDFHACGLVVCTIAMDCRMSRCCLRGARRVVTNAGSGASMLWKVRLLPSMLILLTTLSSLKHFISSSIPKPMTQNYFVESV